MQAPRPLCFIIYLCINACITLFDNSSLEYGLKSESIVPITLHFLSMIVLISWYPVTSVSYTHLTLPTTVGPCGSRWSPYH